MDSDQRLQALRNAYADVILNTSKEAASRVMAAERKAQQLEQEIRGTKDEAVQMMVRLKKKMDDEISEANMTSRNQQEKINELEAQLQEAEDIVTELREQLRHEQAKFDRVTRRDMQHLDKHDNATPEEAFEDNRQSQSIFCPPLEFQKDFPVASDKENPYLNQRTEYPKCSGEPQMRNLYGAMPELPSIILRSKKHKLYRNACTQRIHACERNILDNELSLSRQPNDASGKGKVEGAKKDNSACKDTFNEVHKMFNIKSKEVVGNNGSISCWYEGQPLKLISKEVKKAIKYRKNTLHRKNKTTETNVNDKEGDTEKLISKREPPVKTATKYGKNKSTLGKKIPDKMFMKRRETRGVPHSDPSPKSVEDNPQPNEDPTATKPKLSLDIAGLETHLECAKTTETNENDKEGDTGKLISMGKPPVKTATDYGKNNSAIGKKTLDKLFMKRHETPGVPHSDPSPKSVENNLQLSSDIAGMATQPECERTTQTNNNDKEGDTEKLISNGEPPVNTSVPSVQAGASAESSDNNVSKSNLKKLDEPILQSKLKTTDATSKGSSLQLFKYTFQRKRKREIFSISDGDVPADDNTPERRKETQNTSEEPEKSILVADSSLESRRLAQVTRQLMSLSERKC